MRLRHLSRGIVVLSFAMALAACGTTGGSKARDTSAQPETGDYVIGAGDQLEIHVRDNPDLSVNLPVRPDGKISVPLIEEVEAAGRSPASLSSELEERLAKYVRDPNVTVIVQEFVGTYSDQIRIIGEAVEPRAIAYREGMTVLDAIIQVGGLTEFAAGNRTKLVRRRDGDTLRYQVRLADLLNDGAIEENRPLRPGDILIIPEAYF